MRNQQTLMLVALAISFVLLTLVLVQSYVKQGDFVKRKVKPRQNFDEAVEQEYSKQNVGNTNSKEQITKENGCKFGFGFLGKMLKTMLKDVKEPVDGDIIQPSRGAMRIGGFCLDSADGTDGYPVEVQICHGQGRNQEWKVTTDNKIENVGQSMMCISADPSRKKALVLRKCNDTDIKQKWNFHARKGRFSPEKHSDLCIELKSTHAVLRPCLDKRKKAQIIDFVMTEIINLEDALQLS